MNKADALVEVLREHGVEVSRSGNSSCPFHKDDRPSMSLDRQRGLFKCHSCGRGGDVYTLLQEMKGLTFEEAQASLGGGVVESREVVFHEEERRVRPVAAARMEALETALQAAERLYGESPQAQAYVASRGLTEASRAAFRLGVGTPDMGAAAGKLLIPYLGPNGRPLSIRSRCIEDHDHVGHGKYMGVAGDTTRMFNTLAVTQRPSENVVHVAEGEIDCMILSQCGLLSVGFPGVNNVKPHHVSILQGFDKVFVWADNDEPGQAMADRLLDALPRAVQVRLPDGDVAETFLSRGSDGLLGLIGRS